MKLTPEMEQAFQRSVDTFIREKQAEEVARVAAEIKSALRESFPEYFGHLDDAALAAADVEDMIDRRDWELTYGTGFSVPRGFVSSDPAKQREAERRRAAEEAAKVTAWERLPAAARKLP